MDPDMVSNGVSFDDGIVLTLSTEIPQYIPGAAYRQLEFLLGRIKSLQDKGPYTTQ